MHRDIKSDNLLVSEKGEIKLADDHRGSYRFTVLRDEKMWILSNPDCNKCVVDTSFWSFIWGILKKKLGLYS